MTAALRLELRRSRSLLVWLGAVAVLYAGGITLFYPTIIANAAQFEELLKVYPKEIMAAFGITGSLADPGTFLGSYVFAFLWPLIAAIAAILLATRPAADAETGFLDLPVSTRLPRVGYLGASIVTQVVAIAALAVLTVLAIKAVDLVIEPDFDSVRLATAGGYAILFGLAIAGVTTAFGVMLLSRGQAGGLAAGILIVMYLANVIGQLDTGLAWVADLSAFHYFDLKGVIDDGTIPIDGVILYAVAAILGWLIALFAFRRRDLVA
jgi:beta-exotoxin I transport system permease protein